MVKERVSTCSFLGLSSVEIKSDDGYQIGRRISSDNHRPILYHAISFIQREPGEIIHWVIVVVYPDMTRFFPARVGQSVQRQDGGRSGQLTSVDTVKNAS